MALICNDKVTDHTFKFIRKKAGTEFGPSEVWVGYNF